jgi:hypothetical protein
MQDPLVAVDPVWVTLELGAECALGERVIRIALEFNRATVVVNSN